MANQIIIDLEAYATKIDKQQKNLKHSLVFNEKERNDVNEVYNELRVICKNRIAFFEELNSSDES